MDSSKLADLEDPEWMRLFQVVASPEVSECQVNGPDSVWINHNGKNVRINDIGWDSDAAYAESVRKALGESGFVRSVMPYDPNGSLLEGPIIYTASTGSGEVRVRGRAHVALPPTSDVPLLTFAKKSRGILSLDDIEEKGSMSEEMLRFIKAALYSDCTIVISGGTGAGKTTMLESCTRLFPHDQRIGVCEDTPELELTQKNTAYLHSFPRRPGMDEKDVANLSWIVQQINRMRTDRVIVGETRGKEFADFLVAANSGMDGSMTTIHANDPKQCLTKMTNFALRGAGENVPIRAVNVDIANAVDLIIQLGKDKASGRRYVAEIVEVTNTVSDQQNATITTAPLWRFNKEEGIHEQLTPPSDPLRNVFTAAGIDVKEFVIPTHKGSGKEPDWLPGRGPSTREARDKRTLRSDKKLQEQDSAENQKKTEKQENSSSGRSI